MGNIDEITTEAFKDLESAVYKTLETYSNVHRGTGHYSLVTTALYEQAREIVLEYLQLDKKKYVVVFWSPLRLKLFKSQLKSSHYHVVSSKDFGLPLGIRAIAIKKKSL